MDKKEAQKRWYENHGREYWKKYHEEHRESDNFKCREYYSVHKEDLQRKAREKRKRIREEVIQHYGGRCACCGESQFEFLTIDHIHGGGTKHRESLGGANYFYNWLIKNNFPEGFQVLCMNCNWAKRFGRCPHEKE